MIQPIEKAIEEIKSGKMIILVDSEDRENEGDLVIAAEFADKSAINFMATHGRGLICIPMTEERLAKLELSRMVSSGGDHHGTAFTVSVDAKKDVTTGISAGDRARTIAALIDERTMPNDLMRPGHLFPLQAVKGGVLRRAGHTEASVDLCLLANLKQAYTTEIDDKTHVALVKGNIEKTDDVLVRVHSECLTGDIFMSNRCDCGPQLHAALKQIEKEGKGILVYMRQEGRGIGLVNKLKAYAIQDTGLDTVEANEKLGFAPDLRDYGIGAQILRDIGVEKMRIMTNNPRKLVGLEGYGLEITGRVPLEIESVEENHQYLLTKKNKLGHILGIH